MQRRLGPMGGFAPVVLQVDGQPAGAVSRRRGLQVSVPVGVHRLVATSRRIGSPPLSVSVDLDQRRTFIIVAEGPIGGGANPNEVLAIVETDPTGARLPRGSSTPSLAVEEAAEMPAELLGHAVLAGWRGGPALDPDQLGTVVSALGQVLVDNPDLKEIEINPLRVTRSGLIALDAVVTRRSTDGQPDQ